MSALPKIAGMPPEPDAELERFSQDAIDLFKGRKTGHMNPYAFNEPRSEDDPVRGGTWWTKFIEQQDGGHPGYYLISDEADVIERHGRAIAEALPKNVQSHIDLGPGESRAVLTKTLALARAMSSRVRFCAVDINSAFAKNAANLIAQARGLKPYESTAMVEDFLSGPVLDFGKRPRVFSLFGGLLCNGPRRNNTTPVKQLTSSFNAVARHMHPGDMLIITQDTNSDEKSLRAAYDNELLGKYVLSVLHKIKRDLKPAGELFDPYAFEFEMGWNPQEKLVTLSARPTKPMSFRIAGKRCDVDPSQPVPLVNSYKFSTKDFQQSAEESGLVSRAILQGLGDKIALHVFERNDEPLVHKQGGSLHLAKS